MIVAVSSIETIDYGTARYEVVQVLVRPKQRQSWDDLAPLHAEARREVEAAKAPESILFLTTERMNPDAWVITVALFWRENQDPS